MTNSYIMFCNITLHREMQNFLMGYRVLLFSLWPATFAVCKELSCLQLNKVLQSNLLLQHYSGHCVLVLSPSSKCHLPHTVFEKGKPCDFCWQLSSLLEIVKANVLWWKNQLLHTASRNKVHIMYLLCHHLTCSIWNPNSLMVALSFLSKLFHFSSYNILVFEWVPTNLNTSSWKKTS